MPRIFREFARKRTKLRCVTEEFYEEGDRGETELSQCADFDYSVIKFHGLSLSRDGIDLSKLCIGI